MTGERMNITIDFYLFRPPVAQGAYLGFVKERFYGMPMGSAYHSARNSTMLTLETCIGPAEISASSRARIPLRLLR